MGAVVILSEYDINNLKSYDYLLEESRSAAHIAIDKLIVLKTMINHGGEIDKDDVSNILQQIIDLTRTARGQNDLLIKYMAEAES